MNPGISPWRLRGLSRRTFMGGLGASVAAAAGVTLAGCSSDRNSDSDSISGDVLFWHPYGQEERQAQLQAAVDIFEEENAGTKVTMEYVPWGDLPIRWPAAQQGGTLPDLMINLPENILPMVTAGAVDLDAMDGLVELLGGDSFFTPGFLDKNGRYDGKTFTVPHYAHNRLLIYRSDRLEAAGLDVPETLEEAAEAAAALTNAPEYYGWTMPLSQSDIGGGYLLWMITRSNGGSLVSAEGEQFWMSEEVRSAADYLATVARDSGPAAATTTVIGDMFNRMHDGTSSMLIDSAANIAVANSTEGLDPELVASLNATHVPIGTQPGHMVGAVTMSIPTGAKVAAAHALAEILYRPDVLLDFLLSIPMYHFPATTNIDTESLYADPLMAKYKDTVVKETLAGIEEGSVAGFENGANPFIGPIFDANISEILLQDVAFGGVSLDDALDKAAAASDDIVSRIRTQLGN